MPPLVVPSSESQYGYVVGQVIRRVADTIDGDDKPDIIPATGSVSFTPKRGLGRTTDYSAFLLDETIVCPLDEMGRIIRRREEQKEELEPGVFLAAGEYTVAFKVNGSIPGFDIQVTTAHTKARPLDLAAAGVVGQTMLVSARGLIITSANVASIPAGTTADNLAAYYNHSTKTITVAGVKLAPQAYAVWAWVSGKWVQLSGGTSSPPVDTSDKTPPVWAATLTTGIATGTSVVISASKLATDNVAVTGYRWRLSSEDAGVARPITPSGLNFTIDGLTPATGYAAPILWAVDAGGNKSAELVAQGFATAAAPKKWTRVFYDTFTDADGRLLSAHTPDMGGAWTMGLMPECQVILDGALQAVRPSGYSGGATPGVTATKTFANSTRDVRVRVTIDMRGGRLQLGIHPANLNNALDLNLLAGSTILDMWGGGGTSNVVETTGLTAHMGTGVHDVEFTVVGDIATLRVDGSKLREWAITWGTWGTYAGTLTVGWGAASWYVGGTPEALSNRTSSVEIEVWK